MILTQTGAVVAKILQVISTPLCSVVVSVSLRWRQNGHYSVLNHQSHLCLLNRLFGCRSKKTSKLRVTGLCAGNSPGTGEFPAQMASNAENVSIWWRHHVLTWMGSGYTLVPPLPICTIKPGLTIITKAWSRCKHSNRLAPSQSWILITNSNLGNEFQFRCRVNDVNLPV